MFCVALAVPSCKLLVPGLLACLIIFVSICCVQVDTWALGCLLLTLRTALPPFWHLLALEDEAAAAARRTYEEVLSCGHYSHLESVELDLLQQCLVQDWMERPCAETLLLEHAYFRDGVESVRKSTEEAMKELGPGLEALFAQEWGGGA